MGEETYTHCLPELKDALNENTIECVYTIEIPCNLPRTIIIKLSDGREIAIDAQEKKAWRWREYRPWHLLEYRKMLKKCKFRAGSSEE